MIYITILAVWMLINMVVQILNDLSIDKGKHVIPHILGQIIKYCTWAWLIYEIAMHF